MGRCAQRQNQFARRNVRERRRINVFVFYNYIFSFAFFFAQMASISFGRESLQHNKTPSSCPTYTALASPDTASAETYCLMALKIGISFVLQE